MNKRFAMSIVIYLSLLAACGPSPAVQPTVTLTTSPTTTFTPLATMIPTSTFTPSATPTLQLPVLPGTQMPVSNSGIAADNIDQVVELARWGKGAITDAAYSPDGKLIAVSTTLSVSLYQAESLDEIFSFETGESVNRLAFSPNGETIVTGLSDNALKLWKISDGTLIKTFEIGKDETTNIKEDKAKDDKEEITAVAFSPDGNLLASGSSRGIVNLWQVSDGSLIRKDTGHLYAVTRVLFSPDGQYIFSASIDGGVQKKLVSDGKLQSSAGGNAMIAADLSNDGEILATYDRRDDPYLPARGNLSLWNTDKWSAKKLLTIQGGTYYGADPDITDIDLSPDGQFVAAVWANYSVSIWRTSNGTLQSTLEDLIPKTFAYYYISPVIKYSPDGERLLIAGPNLIGIWDMKDGSLLKNVHPYTEPIYGISLSPDGQIVASVEGIDVHLRRVTDGSSFFEQDERKSVSNVAFSPDGKMVAIGRWDSTAQLWPAVEQVARQSFSTDTRDEWVTGVAFSPDNQTLAMAVSSTIELRLISDGSLQMNIFTNVGGYVTDMTYSPDGSLIAFAANDLFKLFEVKNGKLKRGFVAYSEGNKKEGNGVAFSPDGTMIATGGDDKIIRMWRITDGDLIQTIDDTPEAIYKLLFSRDGSILVAGMADGSISVWKMPEGTLLKTWRAHSNRISGLLFSPDGEFLITSSYDGTIRVWGLKP